MAEKSSDIYIKEGDQVILRKDKNMKVIQVRKNRQVWMEKIKFTMDSTIGESYGTTFEAKNKTLVKVVDDNETVQDDLEAGKDNRNLVDTKDNQVLKKEDIEAMRQEGKSGGDIVDQLIENSATFKDKTEFAQQKYIKKKKRKHLSVFTVLKPTTRLLAEMYFNKGSNKICYMRMDTLGQILTQANVRAHSNFMVVETCVGLVLGAVMERLAGFGNIVQLHPGNNPVRPALEAYNFPAHYFDGLHGFPLDQVSTLKKNGAVSDKEENCSPAVDAPQDSKKEEEMEHKSEINEENLKSDTTNESESQENRGVKRKLEVDEKREQWKQEKRRKQLKSKEILEQGNMDGLIVATKYHPTPIVLSLIDYVAPSRPIVIYSQFHEPLMDCYVKLKERGGVMNLKLSETWLREYQVLPNRTHPQIQMNGGGGYLLYGITVEKS